LVESAADSDKDFCRCLQSRRGRVLERRHDPIIALTDIDPPAAEDEPRDQFSTVNARIERNVLS
jgi:hypothetical protein